MGEEEEEEADTGVGLMSIKVGLESTKVVLTDIGKKWFTDAYPQGIIYEYDEDGTFRLDAMMVVDRQAIAQIICPLGIPYRIPANIDGQTTFKMVES
ncbi:unnamed protein product [marine sediment metagenome]|uniref:Uncharacterized protein n=1 Tax=marine sediment metagenome TaxID=412755 RepID=X1HHC0_9ZZZZ